MTRWAVHFLLWPSIRILTDLAEAFPNVQITAYADNVIISGPLTDIKAVIGDFQRETFRAGLRLNTAESILHIPSWVAQPDDLFLQTDIFKPQPKVVSVSFLMESVSLWPRRDSRFLAVRSVVPRSVQRQLGK